MLAERKFKVSSSLFLYSSSSSTKRPLQENSGLDQHVSFVLYGRYLSQVEVKFLLKAWKRTRLSLVYMHLGCSSFSQGFLLQIRCLSLDYIYIYYDCWYVWGVIKHVDMFHPWGDDPIVTSQSINWVALMCLCANFRVTIWYRGCPYHYCISDIGSLCIFLYRSVVIWYISRIICENCIPLLILHVLLASHVLYFPNIRCTWCDIYIYIRKTCFNNITNFIAW